MKERLLAVTAFAPAIYCAAFMGLVILCLATDWKLPTSFVAALVAAHFAIMLLLIVLFFYYAMHVTNNNQLTTDQKALWIILLFAVNIVAIPIYILVELRGIQVAAPVNGLPATLSARCRKGNAVRLYLRAIRGSHGLPR